MSTRGLCLGMLLALAGCVSQPEPKPDDMSAAAHRAEASKERREAQERLAAHREGVGALDDRLPGELAGALPSEEMGPGGHVFHPNGATPDLFAAEAHAAHARQHEGAAAALERFEEAECRSIPPEERAACPMMVGAGAVTDVRGGVEIRFRVGAPVDEVERRMRCHFAYARTRGFDVAAECPLYVRGLVIRREGKQVIRLTAQGTGYEKVAGEIRRRAREQVKPAARGAEAAVPTT